MIKCPAPHTIPHYEEKWNYLLHRKNNAMCPIAWEKNRLRVPVEDMHHAKVHNIKWVRKKYYLVVHSLWNFILVNHDFHLRYGSYGKTSDMEVEKMQKFLEQDRHWKCRVFLNEVRWAKNEEKNKYV